MRFKKIFRRSDCRTKNHNILIFIQTEKETICVCFKPGRFTVKRLSLKQTQAVSCPFQQSGLKNFPAVWAVILYILIKSACYDFLSGSADRNLKKRNL